MVNKAEYLVVDTTAFIQNANLQDLGNNIISLSDVVNEVKSKRQLRQLVVLPYDLQIKDVFPENINFVTEFSKKTGDYPSLSATDIKVIALTYQLEKDLCGTEHLKSAPVVQRSVTFGPPRLPGVAPTRIGGFYKGQLKKKPNNEADALKEANGDTAHIECHVRVSDSCDSIDGDEFKNKQAEEFEKDDEQDIECSSQGSQESSDSYYDAEDGSQYEICESENENNLSKGNENSNINSVDNLEETGEKLHKDRDLIDCATDGTGSDQYRGLIEKMSSVNFDNNSDSNFDHVLVRITDKEDASYHNFSDEDDDCDIIDDESVDDSSEDGGDGDWITPQNIKEIKKQLNADMLEDKPVVVGCITTDFAMQNVLKQIGLNVVTLDGRVIKHLRTFILRCYCCFKTTSVMTKVFCPHCGNKSLKRVAITLDENGEQKIHLNPRVRISSRGKKFSLPRPKGGQHAVNPILCEDQRVPQQRATRLANTKNNPLDPDYTGGFSPFVMRDVNSRSAVLGVCNKNQSVKYWMRKNPNEVVKKRRNKRK